MKWFVREHFTSGLPLDFASAHTWKACLAESAYERGESQFDQYDMIWVWLFFVDDPGGLCEAACKGYLTRRRRGGDGGGGGSLTGGTVLSAYRWA